MFDRRFEVKSSTHGSRIMCRGLRDPGAVIGVLVCAITADGIITMNVTTVTSLLAFDASVLAGLPVACICTAAGHPGRQKHISELQIGPSSGSCAVQLRMDPARNRAGAIFSNVEQSFWDAPEISCIVFVGTASVILLALTMTSEPEHDTAVFPALVIC